MSMLLWPCLAYHNFLQKAYEKIEPMMMKLEYSLKIKRKRSKKCKYIYLNTIYPFSPQTC